MINKESLWKSFHHAFRGFAYAWGHEQNFRIHVVLGCGVLLGALLLRVSWVEVAVLALAISMVCILELVNTVIEHMMDALAPRIHPYARSIKDMMASAVLMASLAALFIGLTVLLPRILP